MNTSYANDDEAVYTQEGFDMVQHVVRTAINDRPNQFDFTFNEYKQPEDSALESYKHRMDRRRRIRLLKTQLKQAENQSFQQSIRSSLDQLVSGGLTSLMRDAAEEIIEALVEIKNTWQSNRKLIMSNTQRHVSIEMADLSDPNNRVCNR